MNHIIITGASRGIGRAIYEYLKMSKENRFYLIARNFEKDFTGNIFKYDLADTENIGELIKEIKNKIGVNRAKRIVLINNAGILSPIKFCGNADDKEIVKNIAVNLMAPMLLTNNFIKEFKDFNGEKKIINISSGAGKHPYAGWSAYTTSKAGIDMFTKSVALEQEITSEGFKIISVAPGIVETDMQKQIRSSSKEDFPLIEKFQEIKRLNLAYSADFAAKEISKFIFNDFVNGDITDIRG